MTELSPAVPIRVLVVEDSPVARELLVHVLNSDPQLQVIGVAVDGEEAVAAAQRLRPDVIVMDIHLPKLDGFAATRQIMESAPTRIVMATATTDPKEVAANFRAIEAGAAAIPMIRLVAIGASTGGPIALQALLARLAPPLPVPILIVQHIADSFVEGFVDWLASTTGYSVCIAAAGVAVQPGLAYVAPNGRHMQVLANGTIELVDAPREYGVRPAVAVLFRSLAAAYGTAAVGILLTGMGRDGARELKSMREAGALTIAQDRESSVVFGMPGEAISLDAANYVLSPDKIAVVLRDLFRPPGASNSLGSRGA